jgi:hypothetical protein
MEDIISLARTKSNSDLTQVYTMRNYLVHGQDFRAKLPKGFFVNEFVLPVVLQNRKNYSITVNGKWRLANTLLQ